MASERLRSPTTLLLNYFELREAGMADEFRSNFYFRGAQRRYLQLAIIALIVLVILGLLAARLRPALTYKYVSLINQGQVQVCRVTPDGVICPPLSGSLSKSESLSKSKSYSPSKSKSYSPSKSISTSTSLIPPAEASARARA